MALTKEIIERAVPGLTPEQYSTLADMSARDESNTIGTRIGEVYGQLDKDILDATGSGKAQGEKTYDYMKRVIGALKASADESGKKASKFEKELKDAIERSGSMDELAKREAEKTRTLYEASLRRSEALEKQLEETKAAHEKEIAGIRVDGALERELGSVKFKDGVDAKAASALMAVAKSELSAMGTPTVVKSDNGLETLVFISQAGTMLLNEANSLKPYTARELLAKTSVGGLIDFSGQSAGAGTGPVPPAQQPGALGARTQVDADEAIADMLSKRGLERGTEEYQDAYDDLWRRNNVSALPFK